MGVPYQNALSLGRIRQELESSNNSNDYNDGPFTSNATSLKDCEEGVYSSLNMFNAPQDRPDGDSPYSMEEWYGYDHNVTVS